MGEETKAKVTRPTAGAPADELLPRKKRKEISQRPVLEILKDKIGMMNSVTNRRQAADHILFFSLFAHTHTHTVVNVLNLMSLFFYG